MVIYDLPAVSLEGDTPHGYAQLVSRRRKHEPHPLGKIVGLNLRVWRERRGWDAEELARRLGIKQGSLSDYERGRRGIPEGPTLLKWVNAFNAPDLPPTTPRCYLDDLLVGVDGDYDKTISARASADNTPSDEHRATDDDSAEARTRTPSAHGPIRQPDRTDAFLLDSTAHQQSPDSDANMAPTRSEFERILADLHAFAERLPRGQAAVDRRSGSGSAPRPRRRRRPSHRKNQKKTPPP